MINPNQTKFRIKNVLLLGTILALPQVAITSAAVAQTQDEQQAQSSTAIENIVVTTRNRAESIQDVPLAVTAFSADQIERRGIQELEDIARFTAGFAFEDFDGGNANPVIRGQSTLRATAREQTVATFIDGVYMPRSYVVDLGLADIERIEIVKGPQSARYGRNAFAGAINYISERPSNELSAKGTLTYGNNERFDAAISLSGPVIPDVLAIRGSYTHSEFDGSWGNDHPNADVGFNPGTNGNVGGWDNQNYSFAALLTPTDWLEIDAAYFHYDREEEARAANWLNTGQGDGNCGNLQGSGQFSLFCGEYPAPTDSLIMEPRGYGRQADVDVFRVSVEAEVNDAFTAFYQFGLIQGDSASANTAESDTLGCGTILGPPVFPVLCNFQGSPVGSIDYQQHEVRVSYDDGGPITATFGGFYMDGDDESFAISINVPALGTDPLAADPLNSSAFPDLSNFVFRNEFTNTKARSVFAEVNYAFPDGATRFSFEGRYNSEKIATFNRRTNPDTLVGEETFKFFTPRITLEHDLTDNNMLFASVARGAKAGGFNSTAVNPDLFSFDPETNWTYEIGAKNTLLDGSAVVNVAAYYTDWSALQISNVDPEAFPFRLVITSNLGDAKIWGFELESQWQATENLSFDAAFSYTEAEYKDGTTDARFIGSPIPDGSVQGDADYPAFPFPCDGQACVGDEFSAQVGGNQLERSPKTQIAFGGQWDDDISDDFGYYIRADVAYQSSFFASSINAAEIPGRTIVNTRVAFDYQDTFELAFWGRNLFDEKYVSNSLQIVQSASNNILGSYFGERLTFGVTLTARY